MSSGEKGTKREKGDDEDWSDEDEAMVEDEQDKPETSRKVHFFLSFAVFSESSCHCWLCRSAS